MKPPPTRDFIAGAICAVVGSTLLVYACTRDNPVEPNPTLELPTGPVLEQIGVIGQLTLPNSTTNLETVDWTSAGIAVDSGVAVRVTVSGILTASVNPLRASRYGDPGPPAGGFQAGPTGWIGAGGGLTVGVRIVRPDSTVLNVTLTPFEQTAEALSGLIQGPGVIEFTRGPSMGGAAACGPPPPGEPCSCPDGLCSDFQHDYDIAGSQTLTVEALAPPEATATPDRIEEAPDTVIFEVTWSEAFFVPPTQPWTWNTVDGQPGASRPVNGAGDCGTATTCTFLVFEPGFMTVGVGTSGASFLVESLVVEIGPVEQNLIVTCTPSSPLRGEEVACAASLETPAPFTVTHRRAEAEGDIVVEDFPAANHAAGETHLWAGTAVATSDVVLEVRIETGESTLTLRNDPPAHFEVEPRSWPTWFLSFPGTLRFEVVPREGMLDPPQLEMTWGFMSVILPTPVQLSNATARVDSGPNAGIAYLAQPVQVSDYEVTIHPAVSQPSHPWYMDQNGVGGGTCVESDVLTFSNNIHDHEGSVPGSTSHVTVSNDVFSQVEPQQVLERMYTPEDDAQLRALIRNYLNFFFGEGGGFKSAHRAFDSTYAALGLALNGIDCEFDFDPSDP